MTPRRAFDEHDEHDELSRRHRPASELRVPPGAAPSLGRLFTTEPLLGRAEALRTALWEVVHLFLFAPHPEFDVWTSGVSGRPAVQRTWAASPLAGEPGEVPDDVDALVEGWFSLVEQSVVFDFLETVHASLERPNQSRFVQAVNLALERVQSDHRFVLRRLAPIASRADVATIERACAGDAVVEEHLHGAIAALAARPDADARGAIHEAIRAAQAAAQKLTGERHLSLDETLERLMASGHIDRALKGAYGGLFDYVAERRHVTTDDARVIVVMCASLVTHLAAR